MRELAGAERHSRGLTTDGSLLLVLRTLLSKLGEKVRNTKGLTREVDRVKGYRKDGCFFFQVMRCDKVKEANGRRGNVSVVA